MARRILVVEEVFPARGGGVHAHPRITTEVAAPGPIALRLVRPDGSCIAVTGCVETAHVRGPLAPYALLRIHVDDPAEVPPQTIVEADDAGG